MAHKHWLWVPVLVLALVAGCGRNYNPSGPQAGGSTLKFMGVSGGKITAEAGCYHGAFLGGATLFGLDQLAAFEAAAGKGVRVISEYVAWGPNLAFPSAQCDQIIAHGSYPLITWEPWNYVDNDPAWSNAQILNGSKDDYIQSWVNAVKAWNKPVFVRLMHEMNGNWYPWAVNHNGNTYQSYIATWRYIVDKFNAAGVTNVTWVWSPVNESTPSSNSISSCFPGDGYVDWMGIDGYNWGTTQTWSSWRSFASLFANAYYEISSLSLKPIMIGECASTEIGGDKAAWITDAYGTQIPNVFTRLKAVVWFNANKETDWRITSSEAAQTAYYNAVSGNGYYLGNENVVAAPVISNIASGDITTTSAVISWNTDIPADSQVEYGNTPSLGLSVSSSDLVQAHSLALTGLTKKTTYYYQVKSTANGQTATSDVKTFRTRNK